MENDRNLTALLDELEQDEKKRLRAAVEALIELAQSSATARELMRRQIGRAREKNAWAIAYILAQAPEPSPEVIPCLLDNLDHPDADIRWAIGLLLARLAKTDDEIATELRRLCRGGNPLQRRMAIYCLRDIDAENPATAEIFLRALDDPDPLVRMAAAVSFKKRIRPHPGGKEALLRVFIEDRENRVRSVAAIVLAHMGEPSEKFLRELKRAESSDNEQIRRAATAALSYLENKRAASFGG